MQIQVNQVIENAGSSFCIKEQEVIERPKQSVVRQIQAC
jgi:hypothetical protein